MKLLHITTIPMSLTFLRGQVGFMKGRDINVSVLSAPGNDLDEFGQSEKVSVHAVPMTRRITPISDLVALWRIRRVLGSTHPTVIHAHTPKGGLLGMIAAIGSGVRLRIYQMRGLPFITANGLRRSLLKFTERVSCRLAHRVLCNSHSIRQVAIDEGLCPPDKIKVLLGGSGNGVDAVGRFNPGRYSGESRAQIRAALGIPRDALVVGFVGRISREKGIIELTDAWKLIRDEYPQTHLLVIGPLESRDPPPSWAIESLNEDPRVHLTGMDWNVAPMYAAMDLVVLPTYREGFPNVALEAAAMGLPFVISNVPGCVDAVEDGKTGTLVPPQDSGSLARAIRVYLDDHGLRDAHGREGRARAVREFGQEAIWEAIYMEYINLMTRPRLSRIKRAFDLVGSIVAGLALSPILATIALLLRVKMGSPILFRQQRPGYLGNPFTIYKFRTMVDARDHAGNLCPDEDRLTPLGQFLRRTSLDELPELWNVIKGDMSLVGPRPLLTDYMPLYTRKQARRHEVRPGITGWAQINGRNATTWEKRLALDVWYVEHRTVTLDLVILLRTLVKVMQREGINQEGVATMKPFRGTAF